MFYNDVNTDVTVLIQLVDNSVNVHVIFMHDADDNFDNNAILLHINTYPHFFQGFSFDYFLLIY